MGPIEKYLSMGEKILREERNALRNIRVELGGELREARNDLENYCREKLLDSFNNPEHRPSFYRMLENKEKDGVSPYIVIGVDEKGLHYGGYVNNDPENLARTQLNKDYLVKDIAEVNKIPFENLHVTSILSLAADLTI